jgi:hypothetical protein
MIAPNYRRAECCASCEFGILVKGTPELGFIGILVKCSKHGFVPAGGICTDFEED